MKSSSMSDALCGIVIFLISTCTYVFGYPYGAPENSCADPAPIHQTRLNSTHVGIFFPENIGASRYTLTSSSSRYLNGAMVRVTLRASPGDHFKGFFIQATRSNYQLDAPDRPAYGTFRPTSSRSQSRRCGSAVGQVGGITHTGNDNKTEISVDWLPPRGCNLGPVQFIATVVRSYSEYWVDIRSDVVQPSGFEGPRGLLCELYADPYNQNIQARVLAQLRRIRGRRNRRRG